MPLISGRTGTFKIGTTSYPITRWSLDIEAAMTRSATSASSGWRTGVIGARSATGTATIWPSVATEDIAIGASGTFELAHGDYDGTGERVYSFSGVVTSVSYAVNVDDGTPVSFEVRFESLGAVTISST